MENKIRKTRKGFMVLGVVVLTFSLIGLFGFGVLNFTTIHPAIYGLGIIIGSGWFLTAYVSK